MDKISVIIPVFNGESFIRRSMESVLTQDYENFEIVVVDDGSSDKSGDIIKEMAKANTSIIYERLPNNEGVHAARNKGMELAKGDIFVFLDADDELLPNALNKCMNTFSVLPKEFGLVFANGITDDGKPSGFSCYESGPLDFTDLLCGRYYLPVKNCFASVRSKCLNQHKWRSPFCDFVFWRKLQKNWKSYFIKESLIRYHQGRPNSLSKLRMNRTTKYSSAPLVSRALEEFLEEFGPSLKTDCPVKLSEYLYSAGLSNLLAGNRKMAARRLWHLLKTETSRRALFLGLFLVLPMAMVKRLYVLKGN